MKLNDVEPFTAKSPTTGRRRAPLRHDIRFLWLLSALFVVLFVSRSRGEDAETPSPAPSEEKASSETEKRENSAATEETATPSVQETESAQETAADTPPVPERPLPPDLKPYRARVEVSFSRDGRFDPASRERILKQLSHAMIRSYSGMWEQTVAENDWLHPPSAEALSRGDPSVFRERFTRETHDKVYLIVIEAEGVGFQLSGREWDVTLETLGHVETLSVIDERELANSAFVLIERLFQPIAHVVVADADNAQVVLRAGEFPPPDAAVEQFRVGDYLTPHLMQFDREHNVKGLQSIPWTYLRVEEIERGELRCSVHSGLRALIPGKRRRLETLAVAVKPRLDESQVHLKLMRQANRSLVGYHVTLTDVHPREIAAWEREREEHPDRESEPAPGTVKYFLSDRHGNVKIPATPERPLVWLTVRSGKVLLARVPYMAGLEATTDLDLPDDTIRLKAEGEVALLQGELIDTVAQGAVLRSRALALLKDGNEQKALEYKQDWDKLPKRQEFLKKLSTIRVNGIEDARKEKDRLTEARVKKLCVDAEELIKRYLDPAKSADFESEFAEFKQLKTE